MLIRLLNISLMIKRSLTINIYLPLTFLCGKIFVANMKNNRYFTFMIGRYQKQIKIAQFDAIIHEPNRLRICAFLAPIQSAEFKVLRDELSVSDSALSKHLKQLEKSAYVQLSKCKVNSRQRTWIHLTDTGRQAFKEHVESLKQLACVSD